MRRREFITLLGGAAGWPLAARAQQPEQMRRIGMLWILPDVDPQAIIDREAFNKQLHLLGWRPGDNVQVDNRWAPDVSRQRAYAVSPDLIVAEGTPGLAAAVACRWGVDRLAFGQGGVGLRGVMGILSTQATLATL